MNNSKLPFFLGCVAAVMLSAPVLMAAPRGGGHGHFMGGRPGMAGRPGMGAWGGQGYGNYGNASPTHSRVAELQRRLAHAGYYHGSVDGVLGPQTRRAIRAYERDHGYASSN